MAANVAPIFPLAPKVQWGTVLTTANTAKDGTGTVVTCFTAGAEGSRIDQISVRALGTNIQTVLRLFVNNGSDPTTAANNTLVYEKTILATTLSEITELLNYDLILTKNTYETIPVIPFLPNGYKIMATIGTTIAAGIKVTVFGGDY